MKQATFKRERREEDLILQVERDKLRTDYLLGRNPAMNPLNFNMLDRARLLGAPSPYMLGDRVPPHPALFNDLEVENEDIYSAPKQQVFEDRKMAIFLKSLSLPFRLVIKFLLFANIIISLS
jgi:hypothetical protein